MPPVGRWRVPRAWEGETVAILASGPSMSQHVADEVRDAGLAAVVINTTFRLAPWANILYAADGAWWRANPDALAFEGLRVCAEQVKGTLHLHVSGPAGFDPDPSAVRGGGHSGYQAVHLAAHAGARRILLCGMDMHGSHWHGAHPAPLRNTEEGTYGRWCQRFSDLIAPLAARGTQIINCTPGSALRCFPSMALADALKDAHAPSAVASS